jgi:hypothetical protein
MLGLGERLLPVFAGMAKALQDNLPAIEAFVDAMMDGFEQKVLPVIQAVADFIVTNIGPAISRFAALFQTELLPAIQTNVSFFKNSVLPVLTTLWGIVQDNVLPAFLSFARFFISVLLPIVRNLLRPALEGLNFALELLRGAVNNNKDGFQRFFSAVRPFFEFLRDTAAPVVGTILKAAFVGVAAVIAGVINVVNKLFNAFSRLIENTRAWINLVAESALGRGISQIVDAVTGRQYGGLVTPNRPFLVGEQGPELFVPMGAGRIMPEVPMMIPSFEAPESGGGGSTVVINVTGALDPEGVARQIERILRDSQRRTGGVLV